MIIYFRTKKLQKMCNAEKEAVCKLGHVCGKKLMQRLQELDAADSLADIAKVPPPRCHELSGDKQGLLSVDLQHPLRLYFRPTNEPLPQLSAGGLDWSKVTEIEIITIEDPH